MPPVVSALLFSLLTTGSPSARAAPICTPRDDEETAMSAEILLEAVMARSPTDAAQTVEVLRLGTLRCSDHAGVVQAMAQQAAGGRSDLSKQISVGAWRHLQALRPDSHLNPSYQARVVHLEARRAPLDLDVLAVHVDDFEKRYGPGSGWEEALAADPELQIAHRVIRRDVLQLAASAAHARARETDAAEDWDRALTWTLRLGGDGTDPVATRAWALAAWESGDRPRAETVLREQAETRPDHALAALGMLATLHWNTRVVTRGSLAAPPEAPEPEDLLFLEGGHMRPRYALAVGDRALLRATDDYLALDPPGDADPTPASLALAAAVVTVTHGQLPESRARLAALMSRWPTSPEASQAALTLAAIGATYAHTPRRDRPPDLCQDHAVAVGWAQAAAADADPAALDAIEAWRAPRCRGGAAE